MKNTKSFLHHAKCFSVASLAALLLAGCQHGPTASTNPPAAAPAAMRQPASAPVAEKKIELPTLRIKAGTTGGFTDSAGHVWLAEQGFADGDTTERPELAIAGTTDPRLYQSERYSMTKFAQDLPNGKYIVKLHFCETYDGITGPGQRVFSFNVAGREFKDFDLWVKAGGFLKAYVESVPVEITGGKLEITFTANIENPQINGLEIIPAQ